MRLPHISLIVDFSHISANFHIIHRMFFPSQIGIFQCAQQCLHYLCYHYLFLLDFVTSTFWLPEWHYPCVWTPVERDGAVQVSSNCLPHFRCISGVYVVHIFFKCRIKLTCIDITTGMTTIIIIDIFKVA